MLLPSDLCGVSSTGSAVSLWPRWLLSSRMLSVAMSALCWAQMWPPCSVPREQAKGNFLTFPIIPNVRTLPLAPRFLLETSVPCAVLETFPAPSHTPGVILGPPRSEGGDSGLEEGLPRQEVN